MICQEGEAEAALQLLAHDHGVLGGEHEGDPARHPLRGRPHRGRGRVPGHRPGVAEAEIEVAVPVDVLEVGALAPGGEDREAARPSAPSSSWARRPGASALARSKSARERGWVASEALPFAAEGLAQARRDRW